MSITAKAEGLIHTSAEDCKVTLNHILDEAIILEALILIEGQDGHKVRRKHLEGRLRQLRKKSQKPPLRMRSKAQNGRGGE